MPEKLIPGTVMAYEDTNNMFEANTFLIKATDGLTLSQVCSLTGLEASTIQNWVKRKFVARPINKKYHERHLARILLISALRDCMKIDSIGTLMSMVNGSADDESDDIISEQQLYDYLMDIIGRAKSTAPKIEEIPSLVENVIRDYKSPNDGDRERLYDALNVMAYAYTASQYKKIADDKLLKMKEADVN